MYVHTYISMKMNAICYICIDEQSENSVECNVVMVMRHTHVLGIRRKNIWFT